MPTITLGGTQTGPETLPRSPANVSGGMLPNTSPSPQPTDMTEPNPTSDRQQSEERVSTIHAQPSVASCQQWRK